MSSKPVILLVEDNELVSETVSENLIEEGYALVTVTSAAELTEKLPDIKPDLILLDLGLPDGDGLMLMKSIRDYTPAPVIIISGKAGLIDKVVGLELGADDYIAKPLEMKEVIARIRVQLRRITALKSPDDAPAEKISRASARRIKFSHLILDRDNFQAYDEQKCSVNLTIKEFRLLETLVLEGNRVLTREQLLDRARSGEYNTTDRAIDVQILRIRKKIGDLTDPPEIIKAVRGVGYTLEAKIVVLA